jgi:hypothetical protein
VLQQAVQARLKALEKRGRRCGPMPVADPGTPQHGRGLGPELLGRLVAEATPLGQPLWLRRPQLQLAEFPPGIFP